MTSENDCVDYPNANTKHVLEKTLTTMGYKDFKVSLTMASSKGDNYLGVIYRASVLGKTDNDEIKRSSLILKTAPNYDREKFPLKIIYNREIYSYNNLLITLANIQDESGIPENEKFKFVNIYLTDSTENEEVLIMEDLKEYDFIIANRKESLTYNHVMLMMKHLAYFHALSFKLKQDNIDKFNEIAGNLDQGAELNELFEKFIESSLTKAMETMEVESDIEKLRQFQKNAFAKFRECLMGDFVQPYTVLCHGDCWTNNILFKYENGKPVNVCLVDWQMVKRSSPLLDLLYFMFSSTDDKVRENFDEFLDCYYETLTNSLNRLDCDIEICFPKSVFEEHIKLFLPFGLIMGCVTAPMFMSESDDIPDMEEILKNDDFDPNIMDLKNEISKINYERRVRGIVSDVIKLGGI